MWNSPFGKGLAAWAGLVIDGLAVVWIAPSNAAHVLPLIAHEQHGELLAVRGAQDDVDRIDGGAAHPAQLVTSCY